MIQTFTVQVNSESLDSVVHFVDNSFQESELQMPYQEIPTALIFGGVHLIYISHLKPCLTMSLDIN